jgi:RNA polymerase sigma factor (sigma-70 family)
MDDALLVRRALAGDLDAFGQLYDRYFNRIYDFAWRILRDADEAADVTQDVFMKAMNGLPSLAKAASFKSWLFTIAHNVAISRAERAGRTVPLPSAAHEEAFGAFDVPDPSRLDNPALVAEDGELASLVWEAVSALNPRDYALLDLHVRQGLESAEIAGVMNVSKGNAYTMVSRMKSAAADVISSYVVARRGSADCEGLRAALAPFEFPPYTAEIRKAVDEHIAGCDVCQKSRKRLVAPLEIFGSFAAVPAPFTLKGDTWSNLASSWPYGSGNGGFGGQGGAALAGAGAVAAASSLPPSPYATATSGGGGGGGWDSITSPMSEGGEWDRNKLLLFGGALLGLLVFAFAVGALIANAIGGDDNNGGGVVDGTATVTAEVSPSSTPGVEVETSTPSPETPTPEAPDTPTAAPETPTPEPAATDTPAPPATPTRRAVPTEPPNTPTPPSGPRPTNTPIVIFGG